MGKFEKAIDDFESAATWLGAVDEPALVSLRAMAEQLDGGDMKPALLSQYGLAYRALLARAPKGDDADTDPLEAALKGAEGDA